VRLTDEDIPSDVVLKHPQHQAAQRTLADLIGRLRACTIVHDGFELQQELLGHLLTIESDRNAFSHAVKLIARGKSPQAGAPEPQSGLDVSQAETWRLERDICERIARQYRSVGDALAWRVFGFERRYILALCRNAAPGVMAGKEGLKAERMFVEDV
jgi:hypothetical protein